MIKTQNQNKIGRRNVTNNAVCSCFSFKYASIRVYLDLLWVTRDYSNYYDYLIFAESHDKATALSKESEEKSTTLNQADVALILASLSLAGVVLMGLVLGWTKLTNFFNTGMPSEDLLHYSIFRKSDFCFEILGNLKHLDLFGICFVDE